MNIENQFYSSFNQCSLFVTPPTSTDELQGFWSPFSTPSISPYGSPPESSFQYSSLIESTNPCDQMENSFLPVPIGKPPVSTDQAYKTQSNNKLPFTQKRFPKRSEQVDMKDFIQQAFFQIRSNIRMKMCSFCKSNGEDEVIYKSHSLKSSTNKITCPILLRYTCTECGATGENTHTIKYCPVMQKKQRMLMLNKIVDSN